ncbi:MAG: hypothetical protein ACRD12_23075 [Acidimicrobiales bacterium]
MALMRRVLWPDPRYESRSRLLATSPDGHSYSLAMVWAGSPCVLPKTDRLAIVDPAGTFQVARSALADLPVVVTDLDDQLVEAVDMADWPELCRRARVHELHS